MKKVLEFLENMGSNSTVNCVNDTDYKAFVRSMAFDTNVESAIFNRDTAALETAVGNTDKFVCAVCLPDGELSDLSAAA